MVNLKDTTIGNAALGFIFVVVMIMIMLPLNKIKAEEVEVEPVPVEGEEVVEEILTEEDYRQIRCMAINSYFEARNEPREGIIAVHNVVLNRVADERFPDTPCEVVYQRNRRGCQFSWFCDGKSDYPANRKKYDELFTIAEQTYSGLHDDVTGGAQFYHATYVSPRWRHAMDRTTQIGLHIFYDYEG